MWNANSRHINSQVRSNVYFRVMTTNPKENSSCQWIVDSKSHTTHTVCCCWLSFKCIAFRWKWCKCIKHKILGAQNQKLLDIFVAFDCLSIVLFFALFFFLSCIYLTFFSTFCLHIKWVYTRPTRWSNENEEKHQSQNNWMLSIDVKILEIYNMLKPFTGILNRTNFCPHN